MFNKTDDTIVTTSPDDADVENAAAVPHDASPHRIVEEREDQDLSRSLKQRHIQLIALAGAIVSSMPSTPHS
jgi:amino acid permease